MSQHQTLPLLKLRLLVAFLGEKRQANWWDCGFLAPTGQRFLQETFPRTALEAGLRSTSQAARSLHDSRIGRVGVFHLFRLPVDKEDILEAAVPQLRTLDPQKLITSKEAALAELGTMAKAKSTPATGPVRVAAPAAVFTPTAVSEMAAHYHAAFAGGSQCFPYFSGDPDGRQ
jgi:hypothetical protein